MQLDLAAKQLKKSSELKLESVTDKMASTTIRSGKDYLASIRGDGRRVYINGELVRDVTSHPAFRGAARSVARLYDVAAAPENRSVMTFQSPTSGGSVLRCYQIPKTPADLTLTRQMSERWAGE